MATNSAELWPDYEKTGEDDLLALLDGKADAAFDESNPAVDKRLAKDFAQAIASYEWLKEHGHADGTHNQRLQARANEIRSNIDIESWRPR